MMACGGVWSSLEEGRPGGVQEEIPIRDLVGVLVLENPILMDSGLVGEGGGAHHRFVGRHRDSGEARDHVAGADDLGRVDAGVHTKVTKGGTNE